MCDSPSLRLRIMEVVADRLVPGARVCITNDLRSHVFPTASCLCDSRDVARYLKDHRSVEEHCLREVIIFGLLFLHAYHNPSLL